ncbi:hypothetical protein K523DRAFT_319787 [Schizophyllum commune Tattone D]|nr:hypothetical protein K523DRAFT_319787 [Schizophyllum commune Tattone D]
MASSLSPRARRPRRRRRPSVIWRCTSLGKAAHTDCTRRRSTVKHSKPRATKTRANTSTDRVAQHASISSTIPHPRIHPPSPHTDFPPSLPLPGSSSLLL